MAASHKAGGRGTDVSRETSRGGDPEQIGIAASRIVADEVVRLGAAVSSPFLSRIRKMTEMLAAWGAKTSLTASPDDPAELAFHVIDSLMPLVIAGREGPAALARVFTAGHEALDIGSGAGFPGLVLASASPAHFTLVESRRKRASFLSITAEELGLFDTTIRADRVSPSAFQPEYDLVMTRALGEAGDFHSIARAALRRGGFAMLYAGPKQGAAIAGESIAGFDDPANLPYELDRRGEKIKRIAIVWRRT
ncbi:MAG: 16S rRNA (guanine(527)-N(7))-methyltransferase RsmG [Candidatus Binataceae bacterium]